MKFTAAGTRVCELCGDTFIPESRAQKFCKKLHTRPCPICNRPVVIKYKSDALKCCSKKCTIELRKRNNLKTWGVDNPAKCEEVKAKQQETCLAKYGVSTPFLMCDFSDKRKETSLLKYGTSHPMQSDEVKDKHKNICEQRYGVAYATCLPQTRSALLETYSNQSRLRIAAEKRSHSLKVVSSDGTHLDSTYEKIVYEFCLRNGLNFSRQIPIKYSYQGHEHVTFIDYCIEGHLFECKGRHLLEGCYDYFKYAVPISVKLRVYEEHNVTVITDKSAQTWITDFYKSNPNTHLKFVDIDLFDEPKFPYRSDRPNCFYHVRVNNHMSCFDGFQNERIRYNMILNRMKYSDRFISEREIVKALNVTKVAKQPSWFSKSFAKKLISEYCTSDLIIDPFAGWGTRCDAAIELKHKYIGIDLNDELVKWHHNHGRSCILLGDANEYRSDCNCSVLMCPPYYDLVNNCTVEDYNYDKFDKSMQETSECAWLRIAMNNIPNATEYIMVCGNVDDEFKSFIRDTKVNRSHLGSNTEYIVVVPGKCVTNLS